MMSASFAHRRTGGFTLVELLVAMILIALMVTMLFGALRLGTRTWDGVEASVVEVSERRLVMNFLRHIISQARPAKSDVLGPRYAHFVGKRNAVEFVAEMPPHLGIGGAYLVRLEVHEAGDDQSLMMRRWLYHPDILDGGNGIPEWTSLHDSNSFDAPKQEVEGDTVAGYLYNERVLLSGVSDIAFFFHRGAADGGEWEQNWSEQPSLPGLVKISLKHRQGDLTTDTIISVPRATAARFFEGTGIGGGK